MNVEHIPPPHTDTTHHYALHGAIVHFFSCPATGHANMWWNLVTLAPLFHYKPILKIQSPILLRRKTRNSQCHVMALKTLEHTEPVLNMT
jgi:hypothetical protein